jgi:hypothetical protein
MEAFNHQWIIVDDNKTLHAEITYLIGGNRSTLPVSLRRSERVENFYSDCSPAHLNSNSRTRCAKFEKAFVTPEIHFPEWSDKLASRFRKSVGYIAKMSRVVLGSPLR